MTTSTTIVATCHGVEVPTSPHLGPRMIESINAGRYEGGEIAAGLACIPKGSRILELGAGAGVVGAILAKNLAPAAMMSVEANPRLIPNIRELHAHNGLADLIDVRNTVVLSAPDAPAEVTFHVRGNFLGSSLTPVREDKTRPVTVPVTRYGDLRRDFPHDAIMMDIEGGELDFLRHADLTGVKVIVAEYHRGIYGGEGFRECRKLLARNGFRLVEEHSTPAVWAMVRD